MGESSARTLIFTRVNNMYRAFPGDYLSFSLAKSLRESGIECSVAGLYSGLAPSVAKTYDSKLLRSLALGPHLAPFGLFLHSERARAERLVMELKPDFILSLFEDPFIERLAKVSGATLLGWVIEYPFDAGLPPSPSNPRVQFLKECAQVWAHARGLIPIYESCGIRAEFLPLAVDPAFFRPLPEPKSTDIVFTGSYYREREPRFRYMLYPLVAKYGSRVRIYGKGWEGNANVAGAKVSFVEWRALAKVYSSSKVIIGIHHDGQAKMGGVNMRVFESLASKGFLVSDRVTGMDELLTPGRDLVAVSENEEIVQIVEQYLDDPEERDRYATSGHDSVVNKHTVSKRAEVIADWISRN